jgi:hypothetical protein
MPRVNLPHIAGTADGAAVTMVAGDATNGHSTTNDGKVRILLTNVGGSSRTATFITQSTVEGLAVADKTVTVAANTTEWTSGWSVANFGRTLQIDVSHADLTLAALR